MSTVCDRGRMWEHANGTVVLCPDCPWRTSTADRIAAQLAGEQPCWSVENAYQNPPWRYRHDFRACLRQADVHVDPFDGAVTLFDRGGLDNSIMTPFDIRLGKDLVVFRFAPLVWSGVRRFLHSHAEHSWAKRELTRVRRRARIATCLIRSLV